MIVYEIDDKVYINTTNRCSNSCTFCVRTTSDEYAKYDLWLNKEPTSDEIIAALNGHLDKQEYVFCGYGEPLYRLDAIITVGKYLKDMGKIVRVNTNGQADLIIGKGVADKLIGCVDIVSISLNEVNAKDYQKICRCEYGEEGYYSMLRFAAECVQAGLKVKMSVVDIIGKEKLLEARRIAESVGAELRVRELIE